MKKIDRIYREVLHHHYTSGARFFNQKALARACRLSLGTVNPVITKLEQIGAIERKPLGFRLIDPRRLLLYWAATRDLSKDVLYTTFSPSRLTEIEQALAQRGVLTAYSAYRRLMRRVPVDYSQVFVYANPEAVERAFKPSARRKHNIIVLTPDEHLLRLSSNGCAPLVQVYVDLWQLGSPASRLVEELDREIATAPARAIEEVARTFREKPEIPRSS
jgi:hypothetical protein